MTIEEKAKAYDEALKQIKECTPDENGFITIYPNEIFPELKESENERIRKKLLELVAKHCGKTCEMYLWFEKQGDEPNWCHHKVDLSNCSDEYCKAYYDGWNNCNMQHSQCKSELDDVVKCLINGMKFYYEDNEEATWGTDKWSMSVKHIIEVLEKQSEHANFLNKIQIGDKVTRNEDGVLVNLSQLNRVAKKDKKQGEQKPTEDIERKYNPCYNMSFEEAQEYISNRGFDIPWTDCDVFVDFRYVTQTVANILRWADDNPRHKPVWSEEDKNMLQSILDEYKSMSTEKRNWLKSLRPQNRWKPSETQLETLKELSQDVPNKRGIIEELLEQLKKLMKE